MASPSEKSSSSRSTTNLMPGRIVVACDATKNLSAEEFKLIISNIQTRTNMIQEVDTITVLGVLHKVVHPMGFQMQIGPDSFIGTRVRAIKEEVSRMVDAYVGKLQHSADECEGSGVIIALVSFLSDTSTAAHVVIEVKIVVGAPLKKVVVQEAVASNATWVVLNRHLKKELRFYLKQIPCKVALTLDNFSLKVLRPICSYKATANIEHEMFYSLSKIVPLIPAEYDTNNGQSDISSIHHGSSSSNGSSGSDKNSFVSSLTPKSKEQSILSPDEFVPNSHQEKPVCKGKDKYADFPPTLRLKQSDLHSDYSCAAPCNAKEMNSELDLKECKHSESGDIPRKDADEKVDRQMQRNLQADEITMHIGSKGWDYSDIQTATSNFSSDNLLGEDGYGHVYKGQLKNGQLIAVKVPKKGDTRGGFSDFDSQLSVLSLACHKNVVMLLGYCCNESKYILVYEYIWNRSLEWHLFDNKERILEWQQRHAIAIGIAKGLRFLHEECRGSPILHRDMRPCNIFLTSEFVPLLADCGLAKWNTKKNDRQTKFEGNFEYLAPEYAENDVCSVKTDVFMFGIILIQLISGRRGMVSMKDKHPRSLRDWAMPLIQMLKLDELVDPRLGDSYGTYELYQMARVAYLCVQTKSALRPTVGEVLLILEGGNDHLDRLTEQLIPVPNNVQRRICPQALEV